MMRTIRGALASLAAIALTVCLIAAGTAFANGTTVTFEGRDIVISGAEGDDGEFPASDLFGSFKDVMPGDELEQTITFFNNGTFTVNVYLKAVAHDEDNIPVHGDQSDIAPMNELLAELTLEIVDGETGESLYNSSPEGTVDPDRPSAPENPEGEDSGQEGNADGTVDESEGDSDVTDDPVEGDDVKDDVVEDIEPTNQSSDVSARTMSLLARGSDELDLMAGGGDSLSLLALGEDDVDGVLLITLKPGESRDIIMVLRVPLDLASEFADRFGEVDWLFTFSEDVGGGGIGGGGDPEDPSDPDDPDDPSDPDDPAQPDDPNKPAEPSGPQGPLPITGDNAPIVLALCGLILATIFMLLAVIMKRRRER